MGKSSSSMSLQGLCMVGALQLLWVLSLFHGASAQSSNCATSVASLLPCLSYIKAGNTTKPSSDCCTPLASIITSDPTCICQIVPLAQSAGLTTINETRALEVVVECNQAVPPNVTSCLQALVPARSPSGSPGSPSTPSTTSQGQSDGSSHGSALFPPMLLIASIFVALSLNLGMST